MLLTAADKVKSLKRLLVCCRDESILEEGNWISLPERPSPLKAVHKDTK